MNSTPSEEKRFSKFGELLEPMAATGLYAITCETYSAEALVSTRMFAAPKTGVGEDPATGSAAGTLSAALVHYGVVAPVDGIARFIIEQGVDLGRPSRIEAEVEGARGVVKTVRIGGESVVVLTGEISW